MQILMIGGTKFIGKELVQKFEADGHEVTVFSRSINNSTASHIIRGDRENSKDLTTLKHSIQGKTYDLVYDMCAYSPEHVKTIYPIIGNVAKHIVFFSTAAVYPEVLIFPLSESMPTGPHSSFGDYGVKKAEAERHYISFTSESNIGCTIFRPHYILGKGDYFERHEYLFSRIENNLPVFVPGNGNSLIQLAWYEDVVELFYSVPRLQTKQLEIMNIAGDEYISLNGLVNEFSAVSEKEAEIKNIRYEDYDLDEKRFYDDLFIFPNLNLILDNTIAKKFGYSPQKISDMAKKLHKDWRKRQKSYLIDTPETSIFKDKKSS